jgi:hypothetical protein
MNNRIKISLGSVWDEAFAFFKAEFALLTPLALLGFGMPTVLLLLVIPANAADAGALKPGTWMAWFLPAAFFSMLGSLSVSALALRPGISVREAIGLAITRVPIGIGLFGLYVGVQILLAIPLSIAGMLEARGGGQPGLITTLVYFADLAFMIWLFVRLLPIWAILSERAQSPGSVVRAAFRQTRPVYPKLLLLRIVMGFSTVLALLVLLIPIGAIARLVGLAIGSPEVANVLSFVATGVLVAAVGGLWTVYVARLSRRLSDSNGI